MEYVNFGSAGVKVSRIALGLAFRGQRTADEAQRVIEHAIDSGINLIDCANTYRLGDNRIAGVARSEEILNRVLKTRRDDVVITSKVFEPVGGGPNDRGTSRYHIMREVERSLKRLGTDRIDVYLLHAFDPETPLDETLRALDDLVKGGKVRYIGCCNFAAWQVCRALWTADGIDSSPFICVQNPYSLLDRGLEREMFGLVRDQGLGVMAYSPPGRWPAERRVHRGRSASSGLALEPRRARGLRKGAFERWSCCAGSRTRHSRVATQEHVTGGTQLGPYSP